MCMIKLVVQVTKFINSLWFEYPYSIISHFKVLKVYPLSFITRPTSHWILNFVWDKLNFENDDSILLLKNSCRGFRPLGCPVVWSKLLTIWKQLFKYLSIVICFLGWWNCSFWKSGCSIR